MATTISPQMPRVCISEAHPTDVPAIERFTRRLSAAARRTRLFHMTRTVRSAGDELSLVARDRDSGIVVGHALAVLNAGGAAEVAVAVADAYKSREIGGQLLTRLMAEAQRRGVHTFDAEIEADNGRMLEMFARAGYELAMEPGSAVVRATREQIV